MTWLDSRREGEKVGESGPSRGEAGRGFGGEAGWWLRRAEVDLRSGWWVRGGVERVCSWGLGRGGASYFKGAAHLRGHTFQGCPELPNLTHRGGSLSQGWNLLLVLWRDHTDPRPDAAKKAEGMHTFDLRVVSFETSGNG